MLLLDADDAPRFGETCTENSGHFIQSCSLAFSFPILVGGRREPNDFLTTPQMACRKESAR